jgi:hypothetical protein
MSLARRSCGSGLREDATASCLNADLRVASALFVQSRAKGTGGNAMKKATLSLTILAALTVTTVAFAQDPSGGGPTPTVPDAANQTAHVEAPSAIAPGSQPGTQPSTTTVTAANATAAPMPPMTPPRPESITARQSYRPNRPLLYTGGSMLIASYAATAAVTFTRNLRDSSGDQPTYIPVVGPWMHLANSTHTMLDKALIAGSGVAQGAGLVISALSFIVPEHVPAATIQVGDVKVNFTATSFGRGSAGIGAVGHF